MHGDGPLDIHKQLHPSRVCKWVKTHKYHWLCQAIYTGMIQLESLWNRLKDTQSVQQILISCPNEFTIEAKCLRR